MSQILDWIFNNREIWGTFAVVMIIILVIIAYIGIKYKGPQKWIDSKIRNSKAMDERCLVITNVFQEHIKHQEESIYQLELAVARNNILSLIHFTPSKVEMIMAAYDSYKEKGGNSYIDMVYADWSKRHAKKIIHRRIQSN